MINFIQHKYNGYPPRTYSNATADATIAFAFDFNTAGEKLTKSAVKKHGKLYIPIFLTKFEVDEFTEQKTAEQLSLHNVSSLNIAGNGLYSIYKKLGGREDYQEYADAFVHIFISRILNLYDGIKQIRTGGQTGFDESGAKAGDSLQIPTTVMAPKGWMFRNKEGIDIVDEKLFKSRFNINQ